MRGRQLVVARIPNAHSRAESEKRCVRDRRKVGASCAEQTHAVTRTFVMIARRALKLPRHALGSVGTLLGDKLILPIQIAREEPSEAEKKDVMLFQSVVADLEQDASEIRTQSFGASVLNSLGMSNFGAT